MDDNKQNGACIRVCGVSCFNVVLQLVCVVVLFVASFFAVGYALEIVEVADVSSIPPGLVHGVRIP